MTDHLVNGLQTTVGVLLFVLFLGGGMLFIASVLYTAVCEPMVALAIILLVSFLIGVSS